MSSIFARFFIIFFWGFLFFLEFSRKNVFCNAEVDKLPRNGRRFFILEPARDLEEKKKPQSVSLECSRASPYYIDVLKSEAGNSSGCEPFMRGTLGPVYGPGWYSCGRINKSNRTFVKEVNLSPEQLETGRARQPDDGDASKAFARH